MALRTAQFQLTTLAQTKHQHRVTSLSFSRLRIRATRFFGWHNCGGGIMVAYNKFNQLTEDLGKGVHNLATGALTLAMCAAANAPSASNTVLANLTQVTYTNLSARVPTITSYTQTSGTAKLILVDHVMTASGAVGPIRYIVLYNDTPTSPADPLISWWDYASDFSLANGETLTVDFDGSNGVLQLA